MHNLKHLKRFQNGSQNTHGFNLLKYKKNKMDTIEKVTEITCGKNYVFKVLKKGVRLGFKNRLLELRNIIIKIIEAETLKYSRSYIIILRGGSINNTFKFLLVTKTVFICLFFIFFCFFLCNSFKNIYLLNNKKTTKK